MPITIEEIEEEPSQVWEVEMDVIEFFEQNINLAYTPMELYKKLQKESKTNNIFMNAIDCGLFGANLELMFQKGYIRKGKNNNKKYYFAAKKRKEEI